MSAIRLVSKKNEYYQEAYDYIQYIFSVNRCNIHNYDSFINRPVREHIAALLLMSKDERDHSEYINEADFVGGNKLGYLIGKSITSGEIDDLYILEEYLKSSLTKYLSDQIDELVQEVFFDMYPAYIQEERQEKVAMKMRMQG